jgi:hypothetical protein
MNHLKTRCYLGGREGACRIFINLNDFDPVTYTMSLSLYKLICTAN